MLVELIAVIQVIQARLKSLPYKCVVTQYGALDLISRNVLPTCLFAWIAWISR